jgi:hypothetical protein
MPHRPRAARRARSCARHAAAAALLVCTSLGSCGTMLTRTTGDAFGAHPFSAVARDCVLISEVVGPGATYADLDWPGPVLCLGGLVPLPIDLAVDVLALPIDLVAWVAGHRKHVWHGYQRN